VQAAHSTIMQALYSTILANHERLVALSYFTINTKVVFSDAILQCKKQLIETHTSNIRR